MSQPDSPWTPSLFPKQIEIFNLGTQQDAGDVHPEAAVCALIAGPRETGKTLGICHRVARHLWETPAARVAVICKVTRNATDGGVLCDLTDIVFPEWINSGIGFFYTTKDGNGTPGPKSDGRTRSIYLKVRNCFGGESELRIIAVEHDCEIDDRLRGSRFSLIWLNELRSFQDRRILTTSYLQLRMPHLPRWKHLWIGDTNPAPDGPESWIYKFWYLREAPDFTGKTPEEKKEAEECAVRLKRATRLIEIFMEDNLSLTKEEIQFKKGLFAGDPGEFDRDMLGLWTKGYGSKSRLFAHLFSKDVHVIEENLDTGEHIELSPTTSEIFVGWDLGSSNHAVVFLEKRIVKVGDVEYSSWCALREIESIGEKIKLEDIGLMALDIMAELQKTYGRALTFQHWADDSCLNTFRPVGEGYDYLTVQAATGGKIVMAGVRKPKGSVQTRIRIFQRLLKEKRLYISSLCPAMIAMLENAAKGTTAAEQVTTIFKHVFDAGSYAVMMQSSDELFEMAFKPQTVTSGLVSMRL